MPFSISIFKRLVSAYFFVGNIRNQPAKESAPAMPLNAKFRQYPASYQSRFFSALLFASR
jgi:hypothetical protein